jgi:hypothetical protein
MRFRAKHEKDEAEWLIPVQMNYAFAVQIAAGLQ